MTDAASGAGSGGAGGERGGPSTGPGASASAGLEREIDAFLTALSGLLAADGLGDRASWDTLLESPVLRDLAVRPRLSLQVFAALGDHCRRQPGAPRDRRFRWAARRLNEVFHWAGDEQTLFRAYPPETVAAVLRAIAGDRAAATGGLGAPGRIRAIALAVLLTIVASLALQIMPWPDSPADAARAHMQAAEFEEAESILRSLRQLHPEDPAIARLLGLSLLEQGDHAAAVEALDAALFLRGDDGLAHYFRGSAHEAAGDWLAAKADLTAAARLLPEFHDVQNHAAWFLATGPSPGARDGSLAIELAEAAVAASRSAYYVDTLAAAHAEAGNLEAAVRHQQEAIELLTPETPEAIRAGFLRRLDGYREGRPFRAH